MPLQRWIGTAPLALSSMIASCAASLPPSANPPRLTVPMAAITPCRLDGLPETPTRADLDAAYLARGAALVACDAARGLAVDTLLGERTLQDGWRARAARRLVR